MTFEEYMAQLRKNVDYFEEYWRENNKAVPDEFPMDMAEGDWSEQFEFATSAP